MWMKPVKHYVSNPYYASIIYGPKVFCKQQNSSFLGGKTVCPRGALQARVSVPGGFQV